LTLQSNLEAQLIPMAAIGVAYRIGSLRTLLGSCIGVVMCDHRLKLIGLAHVVMPYSMGRTESLGKFADTAVPELIRQMKLLAGREQISVIAKIAGGANMFPTTPNNRFGTIGEQNLEAVKVSLNRLSIPITGAHVGGSAGRRMVVDAPTGRVEVQVVGQAVIVL
jgi:chemotaxis protein CheD